ncbi:MAG TPA: ribosome maturation factor RimP [Candidatus Limnocylindria bacterium]|nr:ribosome maturation factor RimP [Candidatus Limnocylindria bacterium]
MELREEVRQLARPLADEAEYELVDIELVPQGRRRIVRVLLDKPGGITLGDCARFSRRLADCLDMNQTILGAYYLEVSSPGIQRPIRTLDAVERFAGNRVALTTIEPHEGRRNFDGELLGPDGGRAGVRTEDGQEHWFEWAEVKSAHLVVDPWADSRSAGNPPQDGGPR